MASRRRRRKGIGKVLTSVERKVRRIEKRPGAKRLKRNVVTTEKIVPRAIVTKKIAADAVTANEAEFGVPVISETQPTEFLKEGTLWINPDDGATSVYSLDTSSFIPVTDATAQSIASGKNTTYVQADEPTGGTYTVGDLWIDIDDGNKLYAWSGTAWVARQDGDIAFAQSTADSKNTIYRQTTAPTGGTYVSGDIWFDTDDNNKIYRFNGTNWSEAIQLGGNALANVNANSITAGTIDASVITVSNINAGNIVTGKLNTGLITVSTNPAGSGSSARVEMSSLGFFAYDGSVATVSITNTGTAVFSGTVNANGGTFTGYVTGGTMRFGSNVNGTSDGIYINANNYWYDTGDFKVGSGTASMAFNSSTGALNITGNSTFTGTVSASTFSSTNTSTGGITISERTTGADSIVFYSGSIVQGKIESYSSGGLAGLNVYGPNTDQRIQFLTSGSIALIPGGAGGVINFFDRSSNIVAFVGSNGLVINSGFVTPPLSSFVARNVRAYTSFTAASNTDGNIGDIAVVYTP